MLLEGYRHAYYVCHRRAGKDKVCLNILVAAACRRIGTYLYLFPQHNQARKVIWKGIDGSGMRFLDHIPAELIYKSNSTEMSVELINGSIIQLGGSNNVDALMGTNPCAIVYSEYTLHHPNTRGYLNPILVENGGWEILQGTPRGKGASHQLYSLALQDKDWFVRRWTIEDTKKADGSPVVRLEDIEAERRLGMSEELIRQEYYCDWNVGVQGAYYTRELDDAEYEGRLSLWDINKNLPVYTFWDIGISDATAIWFLQPDGWDLKMVYYYEKTGEGFEFYARVLQELSEKYGFKYKYHYAPHDIRNRQWGASARSSLSLARDCGIHFLITPNVTIDDGLQAVKSLFPRVWFHAEHCHQGIEGLRHACREYDEVNRVFKQKPLHNWASHCHDAFRYFATVWREQFTQPEYNVPQKFENRF
jgi:phage terminase large subunit